MLTPMREKFCQGLADGLTQSDAYRQSTKSDTSRWKPETLWDAASKLAAKSEVIHRVEELKAAIVAEYVTKRAWNLERLIDEAEINMSGAREDRQWSAANGSLTTIGKATGLLSDKLEIDITHTLKPGLSLEELEDRMSRLNALEAGAIEGEVVELGDLPDN